MEKKENLSQRSKWIPVEPVKPLSAEGLMLRFLGKWTAEDLELAIKKNVEVNLKPFFGAIEDFAATLKQMVFAVAGPIVVGIASLLLGLKK